jgi:hypothetical protein
VIENKDQIDSSNISFDNAHIAVFGGPRDKFTKTEMSTIQKLVDDGG